MAVFPYVYVSKPWLRDDGAPPLLGRAGVLPRFAEKQVGPLIFRGVGRVFAPFSRRPGFRPRAGGRRQRRRVPKRRREPADANWNEERSPAESPSAISKLVQNTNRATMVPLRGPERPETPPATAAVLMKPKPDTVLPLLARTCEAWGLVATGSGGVARLKMLLNSRRMFRLIRSVMRNWRERLIFSEGRRW